MSLVSISRKAPSRDSRWERQIAVVGESPPAAALERVLNLLFTEVIRFPAHRLRKLIDVAEKAERKNADLRGADRHDGEALANTGALFVMPEESLSLLDVVEIIRGLRNHFLQAASIIVFVSSVREAAELSDFQLFGDSDTKHRFRFVKGHSLATFPVVLPDLLNLSGRTPAMSANHWRRAWRSSAFASLKEAVNRPSEKLSNGLIVVQMMHRIAWHSAVPHQRQRLATSLLAKYPVGKTPVDVNELLNELRALLA